jgi:hypothetical protein
MAKKMNQHRFETKRLNDLLEYESNSRTHSKEQINQIAVSINKFGFTNPILIDDQNTIIAGHGRMYAARQLDIKEVPCIVIEGISESDKAALVIADNKLAENAGWDNDALHAELAFLKEADYDLSIIGFNQDELDAIFDEPEEVVPPAIEFSERLGEANNYIVLTFDNDIDWLSAQSHFGLKSVHSQRANGKAWSKGIGRVVNGAEYLNKANKI